MLILSIIVLRNAKKKTTGGNMAINQLESSTLF